MPHKNLETTDFSPKKELERLRSLPKDKRLEYIRMYYKLPLLLLAAGLIVFWMLGSFAVSAVRGTLFPKEPVSVAIAVPGFAGCSDWLENCREGIAFDDKKENLQLLTSVPYSAERDDFVISSTLWFTAGQPDIFIVDEGSYRYLLNLDILTDISAWPESVQQLAGERRIDAFALDISDTAFVSGHCPGQTVYLCMYSGGKGTQRAFDIVEYLLSESVS